MTVKDKLKVIVSVVFIGIALQTLTIMREAAHTGLGRFALGTAFYCVLHPFVRAWFELRHTRSVIANVRSILDEQRDSIDLLRERTARRVEAYEARHPRRTDRT